MSEPPFGSVAARIFLRHGARQALKACFSYFHVAPLACLQWENNAPHRVLQEADFVPLIRERRRGQTRNVCSAMPKSPARCPVSSRGQKQPQKLLRLQGAIHEAFPQCSPRLQPSGGTSRGSDSI